MEISSAYSFIVDLYAFIGIKVGLFSQTRQNIRLL